MYEPHGSSAISAGQSGFFFWTRFENLVAKRRKINDRVVPLLVSIRIGMTSYACRDPSKSPVCYSLPSEVVSNYTQKVRG